MKKIVKMNILKATHRFIRDQQGVYMVMFGLLSFILISLAALAVDGSGMLLDKARLADSMEQATLALAAENNLNRTDKHKLGPNYSDKDFKKDAMFFSSSQIYNRDQKLIKGYVSAYMYMPSNFDQSAGNTGVRDSYIFKDFDYDCSLKSVRDAEGKLLNNPVVCWANGDVKRKSGLFLNDITASFDKEVKISSTGIAAVKQSAMITFDIMFTLDLTGSMGQSIDGRPGKLKIQILKEVMNDMTDLLFSPSASSRNRLGFNGFAVGAQQMNSVGKCSMPFYGGTVSSRLKKALDSQNRDDAVALRIDLPEFIDYKKTLDSIDSFNGLDIKYPLEYNKNSWCFPRSKNINTTNRWFVPNQKDEFKRAINSLGTGGPTLTSTGVLIGANMLMDKDMTADIDKLQENTQRILLILSDGQDEFDTAMAGPEKNFREITSNLIKKGMCDRIRARLDTLQDKRFPEKPSRIAFIAFGYSQSKELKETWKTCVGEDNYYNANDQLELLDIFKKIVGFEEEVGRPIINF